ncbi:transposase family, partial [Trichomonas vaginalis G3]
MSNFDFTNVSTVVHDNDNKTKAIIQQYAPNAKITLDPRHCVRAVGRAFEKLENGGYKEAAGKETVNQQKESESQPAFPIKSKAEEPKKRGRPLKHQEKVFHQIYSKVIKWFTFIIMLPIETTKKIFLWKNTL